LLYIIKFKNLLKATCLAKAYKIIPMFEILKGFGLRYTNTISSVLNITEDKGLSLGILLSQTDTVCIR
jgi:hypothetical protein